VTITITDPNQDLWDIYSDMHKSVYGFRPRHYIDPNTSREKLQEMLKELQEELEYQNAIDREYQERCVQDFERRIDKLMADHGIDRQTAIRWLAQADEIDDLDNKVKREHMEWNHGLPYGYLESHP
jgi:ribosome assembly protein YihI (activator of Der GTPase)